LKPCRTFPNGFFPKKIEFFYQKQFSFSPKFFLKTPVKVIDSIPAINVDFSISKDPLESSVEYDQLPNKTKIVKSSLFDGEERKFTIGLENISQIPIGGLEISVEDDEKNYRNEMSKINFRFYDYSETLLPGEKMIIEGLMRTQIDYETKEQNISQSLNIKYKGKELQKKVVRVFWRAKTFFGRQEILGENKKYFFFWMAARNYNFCI